MENHLTNPQVVDFITQNWTKELTQLAFQLSKSDLPKEFILNQIQGKQKAKDKLPTWFENNQILFPKKISIEQASSELTAKFKADLLEGNTLIDLTGGFGVDDYFFSKHFQKAYVSPKPVGLPNAIHDRPTPRQWYFCLNQGLLMHPVPNQFAHRHSLLLQNRHGGFFSHRLRKRQHLNLLFLHR